MVAAQRNLYGRRMTDSAELVRRIRAALLEDADLERRQWIRAVLRDVSPVPPTMGRHPLPPAPAAEETEPAVVLDAVPTQRLPDSADARR